MAVMKTEILISFDGGEECSLIDANQREEPECEDIPVCTFARDVW